MRDMCIYSKRGTKVVFAYPANGLPCQQRHAKKHLKAGATYTVDHTDVDSFYTDVYLEEVPGVAFNSVFFGVKEG